MNTLDISHIKVEKANAIKLRYRKLRKITSYLRAFEVLLLVAVISRLSFQIPLILGPALRLSYEYFHYLSRFLVSPRFVFILGNVIVVALFVNSGHKTTSADVKLPEHPPYEHKILPKKQGITEENTSYDVKLPKNPQHEQKVTISLSKEQGIREETLMITAVNTSPPTENHQQLVKVYSRSKSERPNRVKNEKACSRLRRSNTELIKSLEGKDGCCRKVREGHYPEDHMSNEEFRKTVEDFIAKQQRLLREEEQFSYLESNFDL